MTTPAGVKRMHEMFTAEIKNARKTIADAEAFLAAMDENCDTPSWDVPLVERAMEALLEIEHARIASFEAALLELDGTSAETPVRCPRCGKPVDAENARLHANGDCT